MTDTARHADVVFPATIQLEHLDLLWSWGHHYLTLNEPAIAPVGGAGRTARSSGGWRARLGLDDPGFHETDEEMLAEVLDAEPAGIAPAGLRARGFAKIDFGQGPRPHAEGGFARRPASSSCPPARSSSRASTRCRTTTRPPRWPTRSWPSAAPGAADAEDAPLPQLDVCERRPPARRAARAEVYLHPADAEPRGIADGAGCASRTTGELRVPSERVGRGAGGRRRGADGLVESRLRGRRLPSGNDPAAAHEAG